MASVGDKYIIEIGEKMGDLYRVKGFSSLVFDEYGLSKLERYEPKAETEDELKVGDEIIREGNRWVVIAADDVNIGLLNGSGEVFSVFPDWVKDYCHKTGRHFNEIEDLLSKINTVPHDKDDERYSLVGCQYCKHCNLGGDEFPCSDCYHGNGCDDASYFERRE